MKTLFSVRKKININLLLKSHSIFASNLIINYSKFKFSRKSIYSNKQIQINSYNKENNNNPEDIIDEEYHENFNNLNSYNSNNLKIEDESSLEYKINTMKNLDKSLKKRTYVDKPSLNVNKNKDFLNQMDQSELKKEEKRINKILKKLDSPEFDEYLTQNASKGLDEQDIFNELFAGKDKTKKVSFADLDNLMSLGEKDAVKSKKGGRKQKADKNVIDIDSFNYNEENEGIDDMKNRLAKLQKEIEKRKKPEDDIGPERFEFINLNVDEKEGLKIENKLKPGEIVDQAAKLNRTRTLDDNNEFIDVKKAKRKFISKDQIINQEEKEVGFREDIQKEKIIDIEEDKQQSNFEKEFFESFKKGPFNNATDLLNEKYDENQEEAEESKNLSSRKSKRNKKKLKSAAMEEAEENEGPLNFQKLRNLRKIKSSKPSENSQEEDEQKKNNFAEREKAELLRLISNSKHQSNQNSPLLKNNNFFESESQSSSRNLKFPTDHELVLNDEDATKSLKDLVEQDLNPFLKEHEKALQIEKDLIRMAKVSDKNIIDLKPAKDYYLKKKALNLAKVWDMDVAETKHWYRRLKREEKQIIKALVQRKKFEQKKKLKKIAKQWKIENDDIIEVNYLEKEREKEDLFAQNAKEKLSKKNFEDEKEDKKNNLTEKDSEDALIPEHYKNLSEFLFFGDDKDYLRHYKRTCRNIHNFFTKFFQQENQTIKKGIGRNYDIAVSDIRMNRACTVVHVWYEVPKLDIEISDQQAFDDAEKVKAVNKRSNNEEKEFENSKNPMEEILKKMQSEKNELSAEPKKSEKLNNLENIYKKVELNINKAIPYLKAVLTKDIGLKYAPEIRFQRDNFAKEFSSFEANLDKMNLISQEENTSKLIDLFYEPQSKKFLTALYFIIHENKEFLLSYFEQIQNGQLSVNTLFPLAEDNTKNVAYEFLLDFADVISSEAYNPSEYMLKLIREVKHRKPKLTLYVEGLRSMVTFTDEELENYFKLAVEKRKSKTLESVSRDNKPLKKYMKKNKITYEEMQKLKENVDKKEAINTFLMNFDYKVPGVKSHVISFSEMDEQGKKNVSKEKRIEKEITNISRKEYKRAKEIAKGGKNKAQKFWDDLEKNYK